ncbi:hypothetical protein A0256_03315 [Mucilaginibacter sp. PAMC 26640]|nr:hypothetical protein A0256_03315 [Mucilaginibacter sp. PAMC 26640]
MKNAFFIQQSDGTARYTDTAGFLEDASNPWDQAHQLRVDDPTIRYAEPNLADNNPLLRQVQQLPNEPGLESDLPADEYDQVWPFPSKPGRPSQPDKMIWHLQDAFAQLRSAWVKEDTSNQLIRVAHFDTGYDPKHISFPKDNIEFDLQWNFIEDQQSAEDLGSEGWLNQTGHGTGTLSILAGKEVDLPNYGEFKGFLGIHHNIKIVPFRISRSVILWKNDAFAEALNKVIDYYDDESKRCHVVTMSMGGLPSKAWADAVNRAYEKGIFIVTAAGNNINRMTPSTLVYPARFPRVTAACGVTYDYSPYYKPFGVSTLKVMEGNFGPRAAMGKAMAAFTPNVPWAEWHQEATVRINGAGTSSATPQIAAAAALYYQRYYTELMAMPKGWQRVETIRGAMYGSAAKKIKAGYQNDVELYFGNGILQASAMLEVKPADVNIQETPPVEVSWAFLKLITGTGLL